MTTRDTITFGAVGDIALTRNVAEQMKTHGMDWPFERMIGQLDRADLLFGNMECVAIPDEYPTDEIDPAGLITPLPGEGVAKALRGAGFDFLNLAQNHVLDAGSVGMFHTQRVLEDAGIMTGGVGVGQKEARALVTLERGGIHFGFLCYGEDSSYTLGTRGPCFAYYTMESVLQDVQRYRSEVDFLVVSIHADLEFVPTPSVPRLANFREIARAGADIVLGHHPHVPQGCELVNGCLIAHSLGNCVFAARSGDYMRKHLPHTARSFLLLAEVGKGGVRSFERIPFEIGEAPGERPIPLEGDEREKATRYLDELDAHLDHEGFVLSTWRQAARRQLALSILKVVTPRPPRGSRLRRVLYRTLRRFNAIDFRVDVDRIIEEMAGALYLTAEHRNWMNEILAMGRERWEARNSEDPDPLHRPEYHLRQRRGSQR